MPVRFRDREERSRIRGPEGPQDGRVVASPTFPRLLRQRESYIHTYIHTYIHIYIHTHTHTRSSTSILFQDMFVRCWFYLHLVFVFVLLCRDAMLRCYWMTQRRWRARRMLPPTRTLSVDSRSWTRSRRSWRQPALAKFSCADILAIALPSEWPIMECEARALLLCLPVAKSELTAIFCECLLISDTPQHTSALMNH